MATLDQVEKLREKANVTYDEAKAALDAANGDLLDALIYLEKQGKIKPPAGGGSYSSEKTDAGNAQPKEESKKSCGDGATFGDILKKFGRFCLKLLRKGNVNTFEVMKGEESKAVIPVTVLALLLIFAFWITLPLMIVGLFFGLHYRFNGPDLGSNSVNRAMDSAADAAEKFKKSVSEE